MKLQSQSLAHNRIEAIKLLEEEGELASVPTKDGQHRLHDFKNCRMNHTVRSSGTGMSIIVLTSAPDGDTVYLPWGKGEIHSVDIPFDPANVKYFFTAQMQGCRLTIDRKEDGSYVVYHANTHKDPTGEQSATQPTYQNPDGVIDLERLRNHARLSRGEHENKTSRTVNLSKSDYFAQVATKIDSKALNRRTGIEYSRPEQLSYTFIVGFRVNNSWSFWYQTSSQFFYTRPRTALFRRRRVDPIAGQNVEIVAARKFCEI